MILLTQSSISFHCLESMFYYYFLISQIACCQDSGSFSFLKLSGCLMRDVVILHSFIFIFVNKVFVSINSILVVDTVVIREIIDADWFLEEFWVAGYGMFAGNKLGCNCIC